MDGRLRMAMVGAVLVSLALVAAVVVSAAGRTGDRVVRHGDGLGVVTRSGAVEQALQAARRFQGFTVFYLGPTVAGEPLRLASSLIVPGHHERAVFEFGYGECAATYHPACNITVDDLPSCAQNQRTAPVAISSRVRGAPAAQFNAGLTGLVVYAGRTSVTLLLRHATRVWPGDEPQRDGGAAPNPSITRLAAGLRSVNGKIQADVRLPAAVPEATACAA